MSKRLVLAVLLILCLPATAAEIVTADSSASASPTGALATPNLLAVLDGYLRQRKVNVDSLSADQMVAVMIDWYRFSAAGPGGGHAADDTLIYRYGGWSEGCATAFKLSVLRRTGEGGPDRVAGITLMFEPASRSEIAPFSTASSDWTSIEAFHEAIQGSPAYRQFGSAKPMGVMIERGGLR